jgi:hypothetical protein
LAVGQYISGTTSGGAIPAGVYITAGSGNSWTISNASVANSGSITLTAQANGIQLPKAVSGLDIIVENHSGTALQVYGFGTDTIDDVAYATGVTQMDSSVVIFTSYESGKWYSNGLATGYAKNPSGGSVLETVQSLDALTAAGNAISNALPLTAGINTVSSVSANTGVNLPASAPGLQITVINAGTLPLLVYPANAEAASATINGGAAGSSISLFPGVTATFNCTATNAWTTQPSTTKMAAYNTIASATSLTLTAAAVTGGAASVDCAITGSTAITTLALPTAAAIVAALHSPTVGTSYRLRLINQTSTTTSALTGNTTTGTVTVSGTTVTIPSTGWREFVVTVTVVGATPTVTIQSVATGTWS